MTNCDPDPCIDGGILPDYSHNPIRKLNTPLSPPTIPNSYSPSTMKIYTATVVKSFKYGSYDRYLLKKMGKKYTCTHCK